MTAVDIKRLETIKQLELEKYKQLEIILNKQKQETDKLRLDNLMLQSKLAKANQIISSLLA